MSLRRKLILLGLAIFVVCSGLLLLDFWREQPVDYVPVIRGPSQEIIPSESLRTPEHLDRLERVLRFYDVWFERTDARHLQIHRGLSWDTDTLANYTSKAEDEGWQASHRE